LGHVHVEAQARLRAGPELNGAKLGSVGVDPRAIDTQLGGERRRIYKPTLMGGVALGAKQLDHTPRDGLHGCLVKGGPPGVGEP
jgi:hypothetical protein